MEKNITVINTKGLNTMIINTKLLNTQYNKFLKIKKLNQIMSFKMFVP